MCLFAVPWAAATVAAANMALMTAVTTGLQMSQQRSNAKAVGRHQRQQHEMQKEVSQADAFSKYAAMADQSRERELALSHTMLENRRRATEAQSMSRVMAAEGGVQGTSVGLILGDLEKQNQEYQTALLQQRRFEDAQFIRQGEAIHSGQYGAILASAPNPIPEPDYLGSLADVGASALGTYYGAGGGK